MLKAFCAYDKCAKEYTKKKPNQRFCSKRCRQAEWKLNHKDYRKVSREWSRSRRLRQTPEQIAKVKAYKAIYYLERGYGAYKMRREQNEIIESFTGRDYGPGYNIAVKD